MTRRDFIAGCGAAVLAAARASAMPAEGDRDNRGRIAMSSWSFHNFFASTRDDNAPPLQGKATICTTSRS